MLTGSEKHVCMAQSWTEDVAPYVKNLTRSLLTVGQEGFYQAANCHANKCASTCTLKGLFSSLKTRPAKFFNVCL